MGQVTATLALGATLKSGTKATFSAISDGLKMISKELQNTAKDLLAMGRSDAADAVGHVGTAVARAAENFTGYAKRSKEAGDATKSLITPMKDMGKQLKVVQDAWSHYQKTGNKTQESTVANAKFVRGMASSLGDLSHRFSLAGLDQDKWLQSLKWSNVQQALNAKALDFSSGRMRILGQEGLTALGITGRFATAYNKFSSDQSIYNKQLDIGSKISERYSKAVREMGKATGYNNEIAKIWAPTLAKVNSALNTYASNMSGTGSKKWITDTNMASIAQQVLAKNIEVTSKGFKILNEKGLSAFRSLTYASAKGLGMLSQGFTGLAVKEGSASLTAYGKALEESSNRSIKFRKELENVAKSGFGVSKSFQTRYNDLKRTDDLWRQHTDGLQRAGIITTDTMHKMNAAFNANTVATRTGITGYQALSQTLSSVEKDRASLSKTIDTVSKMTKISKSELIQEAAAMRINGSANKEIVTALRDKILTQNEVVKSYDRLQSLEQQRAKLTGKTIESIKAESAARLDGATDEKSYALALKESIAVQKQQLAADPSIVAKKREVSSALQDLNFKYKDLIKTTPKYIEGLKIVAQEYQKSSFAGRQAARDLGEFAKSALAAQNDVGLFGKVVASVKDHLKSFASYAAAATIIAAVAGAARQGVVAIMDFDQALKDLQAITGATNAEVALMGLKIKEVAGTTKFSTEEVAQGMKILGQAGMSAVESIQTIDAVANLATGTLSSMETSVDLITTAINVFNLTAEDSGRIADIMANALNKSKLTIESLRTAFNYVGNIAGDAGLSLEETAAAMMTLSNAGLKASTIGTGLRRVLSELIDPTKKLKQAAENAGVSVASLDPSFNSLHDIVQSLGIVLKDTDTAFSVFGKYGAGSALALVNNMENGYDKMLKSTDEFGSAAAMARKQMEGLSLSFKNMLDKFGLVAIALGESGIAGSLGFLIEVGKNLADGLVFLTNNAIKPLVETLGPLFNILGILSAPVVALIAAFATLELGVKGLTFVIGKLVALKVVAFFTTLASYARMAGGAVYFLSESLNVLWATMMKNPYIAFIAIATAAVVAITTFSKGINQQIEDHNKLQSETEKSRKSLEGFLKELKRLKDSGASSDEIFDFTVKLSGAFRELAAEAVAANGNIDALSGIIQKLLDSKVAAANLEATTTAIAAYGKKAVEIAAKMDRLKNSRMMYFWKSDSDIAVEWQKSKLEYDQVLNEMELIAKKARDIGKTLDWRKILGIEAFFNSTPEAKIKDEITGVVDRMVESETTATHPGLISLFGVDPKTEEDLKNQQTIYDKFLDGTLESTKEQKAIMDSLNTDTNRKAIQAYRDGLQLLMEEANAKIEATNGNKDAMLKAAIESRDKISAFKQEWNNKELENNAVWLLSELDQAIKSNKKLEDENDSALAKHTLSKDAYNKKALEIAQKFQDDLAKIQNKGLDDKEMLDNLRILNEKRRESNSNALTQIKLMEDQGVYTHAEAAAASAAATVDMNADILGSTREVTEKVKAYKKSDKENILKLEKMSAEAQIALNHSVAASAIAESAATVDSIKKDNEAIEDATKKRVDAINLAVASQEMPPDVGDEEIRKEEIASLDKIIANWQRIHDLYAQNGEDNEKAKEYQKIINDLMSKRIALTTEQVAVTAELNETMKQLNAQEEIRKADHLASMRSLQEVSNAGPYTELQTLKDINAQLEIKAQLEKEELLRKQQVVEKSGSAEDKVRAAQELAAHTEAVELASLERHREIAAEYLDVTEYQWERGKVSSEVYTSAINAAVKKTALTWRASIDKIISATNNMFEAFSLGWERAGADMSSQGELMAQMAGEIRNALTTGIVDTLMDISDGTKTTKEAFTDLGKSIIRMIAQISTQMVMLNVMGGRGQIGLLTSLMNGLSGLSSGTSVWGNSYSGLNAGEVAVMNLADGGQVGGSSPNDKADNIPIMATANEFMQPVAAVKHYGSWVMEAIRNRLIPKSFFEAFKNRISPSGSISTSSASARSHYASGGHITAPSGNSFHVSVPVTVSGGIDLPGLAARLQEGMENTAMTILKREFSS